MLELHLHVHPGRHATSQHHQTTRTWTGRFTPLGQAHLLPQDHRQTHCHLQSRAHGNASGKFM
jgi:hypothetical protein